MAEQKWAGTTYGNSLMHRWLISLLRSIDIRVFYVFAFVFVVPFTLFRPGFKFIFRYFRERFGHSVPRAFWNTYLNHCMFAQVVIDRFAMYAGRQFDIEIEGYEHFRRLAGQPEGFVQLSSHVGNYEIAGYTLTSSQKPMNALVYLGEKESVMQNRSRLFSQTNIRMISIRDDMSHLFEINRALTAGEIVSFPADRIFGSEKYIAAQFLGCEAHFPMGPFRVIAMRSLQAIVVHVVKTATRRYRVIVTPLSYDTSAPRSTQLQQLASGYVAELERIVRSHPTQWYNYFEFWERQNIEHEANE